MSYQFEASCRSLLIGSLPLEDHAAASELVFRYTPEIPLWAQLPVHAHEGMMQQFLPGLPGLRSAADRTYVDTSAPSFDNEVLAFYEEFVAVTEGGADIDQSRFVLGADVAPGFAVLMEQLAGRANLLDAHQLTEITGDGEKVIGVKIAPRDGGRNRRWRLSSGVRFGRGRRWRCRR